MKVYVLVKDYDEGDFGGRPFISVIIFSTLHAATKAMNKEIKKFYEDHIVDEDSIECTGTSFYCIADEYHQYGESPRLILKILEKEVQ